MTHIHTGVERQADRYTKHPPFSSLPADGKTLLWLVPDLSTYGPSHLALSSPGPMGQGCWSLLGPLSQPNTPQVPSQASFLTGQRARVPETFSVCPANPRWSFCPLYPLRINSAASQSVLQEVKHVYTLWEMARSHSIQLKGISGAQIVSPTHEKKGDLSYRKAPYYEVIGSIFL